MAKNKKQQKNKPEKMQGGDETIKSDVLGSYTGNPLDGSTPVQDADDL